MSDETKEVIVEQSQHYCIIKHDDCYQLRVLVDGESWDEFFFLEYSDAKNTGQYWAKINEEDDSKAIYEFSANPPNNAL